MVRERRGRGRLLEFTFHLLSGGRRPGEGLCLGLLGGVGGSKEGRGIYFMGETLVAARELLKREGWEISRISESPSLFRNYFPEDLQISW